jgi:DNA-binding CsgD family transcriptional regulator
MQERENIFHWNALSPREREVVALVCMGQRNYQIAETLGIAHGTVKSHLEKIFRKFNVNDRHAIRLALVEWDFASWWNVRHLLPAPLPARTIYR